MERSRWNGRSILVERASDVKSDAHSNETSSPEISEPLQPHPDFFFDDKLIVVQAEKTLFRVHKYQLAKSNTFSDLFRRPKEGDGPEKGSSPECPIKLADVSASDFTALLRVLYASHFPKSTVPEVVLIVPAFRLANLLEFPDLREYLLPLAEENLDDVDKIAFAREFKIKEWLAPALIRLCKRDEVLRIDEAKKLGLESVLLVWRMREQYRIQIPTSSTTTNSLYCQNCIGMEYYGYGHNTCERCNIRATGNYLRCFRSGTTGGEANTNNTALEVEVNKWVEDTYNTGGE
ncbi:hypothetical protein ACGC1H_005937 [Rhizoctonia solani]|uniref:BTB domain-containing protein n=1 Tax=Rhizoctonia solani TaxID=456999 RepID=A0A8H3C1D8_9AGAM|nr:unnamed protein product [Rhizoctonia solani]